MTGARHPTPAERLLALLEDETAVETLPAADVRNGLDAVGIDPTRCIAFARALAGGTGSPGGRLLGAIDLAESEEDEIARLESADVEAVRAQIPVASAAAIAAAARRQAGADSNIVAMKPRRRSRILRWGGPAAGIAASLLVVAVVGLQFLESDRQGTSLDLQPGVMPQAEAPAEAASRADEAPAPVARYAAPEAEKRKRSADTESAGVTDQFAKQEREAAEMQAPAAPPAGLVGNLNEEPMLSDRGKDDTRMAAGSGAAQGDAPPTAEGLAARPETDAKAAGRDMVAADIAAVVIVDPTQVPLAVQSQALPRPDLAARVDEARRLAGSRPVIALYRVAGPAGQQDFAQVPLEISKTQQMPAPLPLTRLLGPAAFEYDFLALPAE